MKHNSMGCSCLRASNSGRASFHVNWALILALLIVNPAASAMTVAVFNYDYGTPGAAGFFSGSDFLITAPKTVPVTYPGAPNEFIFESFNIAESTKVDFSTLPFDTITIKASDSIIINGTLDATGKRLSLIAPIVDAGPSAEIIADFLTVSTKPVVTPLPTFFLLFLSGFGFLTPFAKAWRNKTQNAISRMTLPR